MGSLETLSALALMGLRPPFGSSHQCGISPHLIRSSESRLSKQSSQRVAGLHFIGLNLAQTDSAFALAITNQAFFDRWTVIRLSKPACSNWRRALQTVALETGHRASCASPWRISAVTCRFSVLSSRLARAIRWRVERSPTFCSKIRTSPVKGVSRRGPVAAYMFMGPTILELSRRASAGSEWNSRQAPAPSRPKRRHWSVDCWRTNP